ncbi:sodium:solute symporter family protein [Haloechinothrix sp. LS1_15]|uniref:sodium:solute symporter family protein n=1 Tax=Haloechinothrix sp. LS1_15 TaxID=2652248 RepID=UPI00294517A9|nr:sodium:solute symporter family protein [Haloechinothrix sp. LS1_15]MDV6013804.1 sodium:solute symporter family protein [Haloechinothrix sp. LS1_15]
MGVGALFSVLVLAYLVVILAVGVYFVRQVRGVEDFALAGRRLGLPVLIGSLAASYIGGATVVGWTGSFYEMGVDWWFSAIGAIAGVALATVVMARRCRRLAQFTVPDLLAIRYGPPARYVSAALIILGDIAIVTVQIIAIAGILTTFTDIDRLAAMVIGIVSFAVISLFGGMKGVAVTDSLQALVIFIGLLAGVIALFGSQGGPGPVFAALPDGYFEPFSVAGGLGAFNLALAALGTTAVSQSLIFSRIFSARDDTVAFRAMALLIPAALFGYGMVALLGYGGRAVLGPDVVPDDVFAQVVTELLHPLLGGILLATVIAAIVTTTNSMLLSASVNVARDLYRQLVPRQAGTVELRRVGQAAVVAFALLSFTLAVLMPDIVTAIVFAYTIYSAGLLIPLYAGFLWRGATPAAGVATIVVGGGTALLWYVLGEPFGLPPMVPALAAGLIVMIGLSLVTRKPSAEQLRVFDV